MSTTYKKKAETKQEQKIRYQKVIDVCTQSIKANPNKIEVYLRRGRHFRKLNRYGEAIADFTKVVELQPNHADAYHCRAVSLRKLERYEEAIEDCTKVLELEPENADAYQCRFRANIGLNRHELAGKDKRCANKIYRERAEAKVEAEWIDAENEWYRLKEEAIEEYEAMNAPDLSCEGSTCKYCTDPDCIYGVCTYA